MRIQNLFASGLVVMYLVLGNWGISPVLAQPKPGYAPSSTHIFPAGGQRGSIVQVLVGAECIPPGTRFHVTGKGVTAPAFLEEEIRAGSEPSPRREPTEIPITHPREWTSQLTIPRDVEPGPIYWRLSCAQGGTGSRPFLIGELPEFIESESNSTRAKAEELKLPVTVNGRIYGERDEDYFRFKANAGDVVVCEVLAGRLGSRLDPVVELMDTTGKRLDVQETRVGSDPVLALKVEKTGEYLLRITNVTVHGGPSYVYRVNISTRPFANYAFPAGGQAGTERDVAFSILTGTKTLKTRWQRVRFPHDEKGRPELVSTAGESLTLRADSLLIDDFTNQIEKESNDTRASASGLDLPVTVDGQLQAPMDEDWFRFEAEQGDAISIRCYSAPFGSAALPALALMKPNGELLATSLCAESADRICRIEWQVPDTGSYFLRVRDMQFGTRGGEDFIYRLSIRRGEPDFTLSVDSDAFNVVQGGTTTIPIKLERSGGFQEAVQLNFDGLPEGVVMESGEIPKGKNEASVTLKVDGDVLPHSFPVQLTGRAEVDGRVIRRTAQAAHLGRDAEGFGIGSLSLDQIYITVQHKPLFKLFCSEAYEYAYRGSIYPYLMEIERLDGFDGEIHLQQGDRQNRDMDGVEILSATIAPGKTQALLPIYLPETMHINVQSQSQLYSQAYAVFRDKAGETQAMLVLSEKRNMLRTLPPVVKLTTVTSQLRARPGEQILCQLKLERTSNFPGPMRLQLREQNNTEDFAVNDVVIKAGQTNLEIPIQIGRNHTHPSKQTLTFRATGKLGKHTIVTEATTTLTID